MKADWDFVTIGDIATVKGGKRVPKGYKLEAKPTAHPYITVSDFTDSGTVSSEKIRYIRDEVYEVIKNYTISSEDVYISIAGTIGKTGSIPPELEGANLTENACKLILNGSIHKYYLLYFMQSDSFERQTGINTRIAAQPKLALTRLKTIELPLPPLSEQKQIVAILGKAFEGIDKAIANTEKNLSNAREVFESYLNNVFTQKGEGWMEKKLGEMAAEFGRGKSKHRPRNAKFLYGGDYPFVQTGDIRNSNHYITNYTQTYSEEGLKQSKLWSKGTVCITIAAHIAETGILTFDGCFPDSVIGMTPDPQKTLSGYIEYLLQFFRADLQKKGKGTVQDNINLGTFKEQVFPFAPLPEQRRIVAMLDTLAEKTRRLESNYQQKLQALNELKQSLLQKAFSGELTANFEHQEVIELPKLGHVIC